MSALSSFSSSSSPKNYFSVIFSSPGFAIVHKPFDCAMDSVNQPPGKLNVQDWVEQSEDAKNWLKVAMTGNDSDTQNQNNDDDVTNKTQNQQEEKSTNQQQQSNYSRDNPAPVKRNSKDAIDGKLRFAHQLDYSTSGLLCLTFSKRLAAKVTFCFEARSTKKEYLALLDGWIDDDDCLLKSSSSTTDRLTLEEQTRNLIPIEEIAKNLMENAASSCTEQKSKISKIAEKLLKSDEKEKNKRRIFVEAPIGNDLEDPRGFKMRVDDTHKNNNTSVLPTIRQRTENKNENDDPKADSLMPVVKNPKPAATVITILSRGYCNNDKKRKCTLVHFQLLTGRRHQLRVHSLFIGHPIVGDQVYNPLDFIAVGDDDVEKEKSKNDEEDDQIKTEERMMLHAWRLALPKDQISLSNSGKEESELFKMRKKEIKQVRKGASAAHVTEEESDESEMATFCAPETLTRYFVPV